VIRRTPISALVIAALIAVLVAACAPQPSSSPGPEELAPVVPVLGCLSIEHGECRFVAEQAMAVLPPARGAPFAILVHLYGCPNDGPCPRTLDVREGTVTVEYIDGGEPIELSVAGPSGSPRFGEVDMAWSGLQQPSSPRVAGPGPFPFDVGHCGLTWQVDFDGSFWLPIGQADGDASATINNDSGEIRLLGPTLAEYRNADGFVATLARFPGPKHVWLCR
jgi:hypothetical protein